MELPKRLIIYRTVIGSKRDKYITNDSDQPFQENMMYRQTTKQRQQYESLNYSIINVYALQLTSAQLLLVFRINCIEKNDDFPKWYLPNNWTCYSFGIRRIQVMPVRHLNNNKKYLPISVFLSVSITYYISFSLSVYHHHYFNQYE